MRKRSIIDRSRDHRYLLVREWNIPITRQTRTITFVILNPNSSTDEPEENIVKRCVGYARRWQFDKLFIVGLYSYIAPNFESLRLSDNLLTEDTDIYIRKAFRESDMVLAGWGNRFPSNGHIRVEQVLRIAKEEGQNIYCLNTHKDGQPASPIFQPGGIEPVIWRNFSVDNISTQ